MVTVIEAETPYLRNSYVFKDSFYRICEIWSGLWTSKQRLTIIIPVIVILALDAALEALALPILYKGIPVPFGGGTKPIGGVLWVATFFHLILIASSIIAILYIARRLGMSAGDILPKSRGGWIDVLFLMLLLVSGFVSWFYPSALILFIISGIYLVVAELE